MNPVDERITGFIRKHHVMTVCTVGKDGEPYCANVFYSYIRRDNVFVFTSDEKTRHYSEMSEKGFAAGSIVLETRTVGKIRGLQLQGKVALAAGEMAGRARRSFLRRFPYAVVTDLTLWIFEPTFMKLTDNTLGFGKKLIWYDSAESERKSSCNGGYGDDREPHHSGAD